MGKAVWRAIFTTVSAFCNAGFALQSDSLIPYCHDALVLHTVATLVILGGLSPFTCLMVPHVMSRGGRPIRLQAKLALGMTGVLLIAGFVFIVAIEWNRSLADLPVSDRVHNAWFQSVTLRTAGFNSIDIASMHAASLAFMMLLMFVGGCPGGTAGGIKTTTAAVLLLAVHAAVRGEGSITAGGRRIADETVHKAIAISAIGGAAALAAYLALQLTQHLPESMALFEVFSALGTVGLSTGATGRLDVVGKLVVMGCMFVGRIGPLTLFLLLREQQTRSAISLASETVDVG